MFTNTQPTTELSFLQESFSDSKPTIGHLIDQYLYYAENVRGMAASTLKGRRAYLRQFHYHLIRENFNDLRILTNSDLDIFFVEMSKRISEVTGRQITTGTVNTCKRAVKGFLIWCIEYPEIPLKIKVREIRELKREDKHPDLLTHKQITTVIRVTKNKQDKIMISVMYEAGLRISEVADMKIEHLRGRTLDVVGKGSRHRITFITASLARQLRSWMKENGWENGYVLRPLQHGDGIAGYLDTEPLRKRIKRLFLTIVGKVMHPHQIRHAFALRLLKKGCGLRSIQKLLGHSHIETTMTYLGIDDAYLEKEYTHSFNISVYA
jgi:site-specific recombinase XerD